MRSSFRSSGSIAPLTLAQVLERYQQGPQTGVFTDGSCIGNPGPGGWGAVYVMDGHGSWLMMTSELVPSLEEGI